MERQFELNGKDVEWDTLFICADCGTAASTNSAKHYERPVWGEGQPTREELERLDHEEGRAVDHERTVRMTPPCPCGCDLFNTLDVLTLDYDDARVPFPREGESTP